MAGPHLTAQTFAAALASTSFPNPGAGAAPSYQAAVGFPGGRHEMYGDFAAFWLDPSASEASQVTDTYQQNYEDYEAFCYVGLGTRAAAGSWPTTDRFFQPGCR